MTKLKRIAGLGVASLLVLSLQGCIIVADGDGVHEWDDLSSHERAERDNRRMIAALDDGASYDSVREQMDTPNFSDLVTVNGVRYRVLYYRTHRVEADGETTRDECTPLVFKDDVLIGAGELALRQIPTAG